ncbi:uncharacterized protein PAC_08713 [Phialocephala subalpina]|uniref:Uncharacterized protein n=1 Tax=Phialocephala subalpina TaxID=576137 RepID=A0A1L7X1B9_9HELO|nr:uncharacterized protein PAC_08713 [Phialocephala subalpina]
MWLIDPPGSNSRMLRNEQVARELGEFGYTQVWIRHCDHRTTRISTRGGGRRTIGTDNHITVYCGRQESIATRQGDVFLVIQRDGFWRIMDDRERRDRDGRGVELYVYPSQRRR